MDRLIRDRQSQPTASCEDCPDHMINVVPKGAIATVSELQVMEWDMFKLPRYHID